MSTCRKPARDWFPHGMSISSSVRHTPTTNEAQRFSGQTARLVDPARLNAIRATGLLDAGSAPVLDRLTRLATRLLGVPISTVSLVDGEGQHFPGMAGLDGWAADARGTPLRYSFCQHVVTRNATFLVSDAATDPLVSDSPGFVELGVVAYAGVPLRTAEGYTLGAFCAIDKKPRAWSADDVAVLEDLAAAAMAEIELRATVRALMESQERLRQQAMRDPLTGLLNRRGFGDLARQHLALAERTHAPFCVLAMDLDGFKQVNDRFGHDVGDEALCEMAGLLLDESRDADYVGRLGGDEFVVLLTGSGPAEAQEFIARLQDLLTTRNATDAQRFALGTSIGLAAWNPLEPSTIATMLRLADESLYADKRHRSARVRTAA